MSGYLLVGVNIVYTLASVPLAFHFLSKQEFGLWALVAQMASYSLALVDLGMSSSLCRILIDHKDKRDTPDYGTVIQTGSLVLLVQAGLIIGLGSALGFWLPAWMNVPEEFWRIFRVLMICQCAVLGVSYAGRIFGFILQAHQRYDICNYLNIFGFALNFLAFWFSFRAGLGLYSMVVGAIVNALFSIVGSAWAVHRLKLFPAKEFWGYPNWGVFRSLFSFGTEMFLVSLGQQLVAASSIPIVTRTLGLEAGAVWSVAIKVFVLAQQLVYRISDFSLGALAEMMVRGERERLRARVRDIMILTGSAAACVMALALCNQSFLTILTNGKISWNPVNDLLMAISFFVYASTRFPIGFIGLTKRVAAMKYVYFLEGAAFVTLGLFAAARWGFSGVIISGIVTNLCFSGTYGAYRLVHYLDISYRELFRNSLNHPLILFAASGLTAFVFWAVTQTLAAPLRLALNASVFGSIMLFLFWCLGLPVNIRSELISILQNARARIKF